MQRFVLMRSKMMAPLISRTQVQMQTLPLHRVADFKSISMTVLPVLAYRPWRSP